MQELRAQIQAQIKLAETLKKLSDSAGGNSLKHWKNVCQKHVYFREEQYRYWAGYCW